MLSGVEGLASGDYADCFDDSSYCTKILFVNHDLELLGLRKFPRTRIEIWVLGSGGFVFKPHKL